MLTQFKTFRFSLIIFLFLFSNLAFTQSKFESGYVIDLNGQRKECLVEIINPIYTPQSFNYKLSEKSAIKKADISTIKEIATTTSKYVQFQLEIDLSGYNVNNLSKKKELEFIKDTLFLECLLDGEVDLFYYKNFSIERFFFNTPTENIIPVHYKHFLISQTIEAGQIVDTKGIGENLAYKKQLSEKFSDCENITFLDIKDLEHNKIPFVNYFKKVNNCYNTEPIIYSTKRSNKRLHIIPKIGLFKPNVDLQFTNTNVSTTFNNSLGYGIGLQFEYYLSRRLPNFTINLEPRLSIYKDQNNLELEDIQLDYRIFEIAFGPKFYLWKNKKINPFFFGGVNFVFDLDESAFRNITLGLGRLTNSSIHPVFGMGAIVNEKWLFEIVTHIQRQLLYGAFDDAVSNYSSINFTIGYML